MNKYRLTEETIVLAGITLHRIEALRGFGRVRAGDIGGFVESEKNLSHDGLAWIGKHVKVLENASVAEDALILGHVLISENAHVFGRAYVDGNVQIFRNTRVHGKARISGRARLCGGDWTFAPLSIEGLPYRIRTVSNTEIRVGCEIHTHVHWLKHYKQIGENDGLSDAQIEEFRYLIVFASKWLIDHFGKEGQ